MSRTWVLKRIGRHASLRTRGARLVSRHRNAFTLIELLVVIALSRSSRDAAARPRPCQGKTYVINCHEQPAPDRPGFIMYAGDNQHHGPTTNYQGCVQYAGVTGPDHSRISPAHNRWPLPSSASGSVS